MIRKIGEFMQNKIKMNIFREYDIRGIFDKELNERSVKLIGYYLGQKIPGDKIVAIGYDARSHSPILRDYLTSGLNAAGCKVLDMGMVATPVNYFSNYIDFGGLKSGIFLIMWAMRWVMSFVLPVPAPATTNIGPSNVVTALCCSGFNSFKIASFIRC